MPGSDQSGRVLGSIRTINGALWAGSAQLTDDAMQDLSRVLADSDLEFKAKIAPAMRGLLRATRLHTSKTTRDSLVETLADAAGDLEGPLYSESSRGIHFLPPEREVSVGELVSGAPAEGVEQIVCRLPGGVSRGTRTRFGVRLAPYPEGGKARLTKVLNPQTYLGRMPLGEPQFQAEGMRLIEHLVDERETPHPARTRPKGQILLGHSWTEARGTSGWISVDGLVELRTDDV
jgi:hypothetical protein